MPAGTLRRLHLGAQQGRCLLILVRPRQAGRQPSPAPLRLDLSCPAPGELTVTVHKQPGGRAGLHCRLPLLPEHLRRRPPACRELPALTRRPAPEPA
ncbi:MAG TPA: cell division protein, partial [Alcanivorax sp.]|nr:cell division protein [Alcanivorax sp.]